MAECLQPMCFRAADMFTSLLTVNKPSDWLTRPLSKLLIIKHGHCDNVASYHCMTFNCTNMRVYDIKANLSNTEYAI